LRVDDIIFIDGVALLTTGCAQAGNQLFALGFALDLSERPSATCSVWHQATDTQLSVVGLSGRSVRVPYAWTEVVERTFQILHR